MGRVNITIIGTGVVGLAVGCGLAVKKREVYILGKNPSFGQGTNSRHTEVIYSGLYYPG